MNSVRTVAHRLADAIEREDLEALTSLFAEDAIMHHPLSPGGVVGRDAIAEAERELFAAFSDVEVELRSVLADESSCVAEVVLHATNTGPLDVGGEKPVAPTGRRISLPSVWWFQLRADGKIAEERDYLDSATLMAQLGLEGG